MKKYDIKNFYVGKLTFLDRIENLFFLSQYRKRGLNKKHELLNIIQNGAIDLRNLFNKKEYTNYNIRYYYDSVYTIFYKGDNGYYCLHNGGIYHDKQIDRYDFCENLVPLKNILPKYAYNIPDQISFKEACYLFSIIYNKSNIKYTKEEFNIYNFYCGILDLCSVITEDEKRKKLCNLERYIRLCKLGLSTHSSYGYKEEPDENKNCKYDYSVFKSVFYKVAENKFYNIYDFTTYDEDVIDKYPSYKIEIGKSFKDKLQEKNIDYKNKNITMSKVLKLTKKII